MRQSRARWVVALVAMALAACSGDGNGSPTSPTRQPQAQTVAGTVGSFGWVVHPISVRDSGRMTLTLRGLSAGDIDLYLTAPGCSGYPLSACSSMMLGLSDSLGGTETITRTVNAGETFQAYVDNFEQYPINYELVIRVD